MSVLSDQNQFYAAYEDWKSMYSVLLNHGSFSNEFLWNIFDFVLCTLIKFLLTDPFVNEHTCVSPFFVNPICFWRWFFAFNLPQITSLLLKTATYVSKKALKSKKERKDKKVSWTLSEFEHFQQQLEGSYSPLTTLAQICHMNPR